MGWEPPATPLPSAPPSALFFHWLGTPDIRAFYAARSAGLAISRPHGIHQRTGPPTSVHYTSACAGWLSCRRWSFRRILRPPPRRTCTIDPHAFALVARTHISDLLCFPHCGTRARVLACRWCVPHSPRCASTSHTRRVFSAHISGCSTSHTIATDQSSPAWCTLACSRAFSARLLLFRPQAMTSVQLPFVRGIFSISFPFSWCHTILAHFPRCHPLPQARSRSILDTCFHYHLVIHTDCQYHPPSPFFYFLSCFRRENKHQHIKMSEI